MSKSKKPSGKRVSKAGKKTVTRVKVKDWTKVSPSKRPYFIKNDGTVDKRTSISKYLTKSGHLHGKKTLPKEFKKYAKVLTPAPRHRMAKDWTKVPVDKRPYFIKKNGKVDTRTEISEYLKKDGSIDHRKKLPKGVRSLKDLVKHFEDEKEKKKPVTGEDDKRIVCTMYEIDFFYLKDKVEETFYDYKAVFMGGVKITLNKFILYGDDYINSITRYVNTDGSKASPPKASYKICRDKHGNRYFFL